MRLIDADELIKYIESQRYEIYDTAYRKEGFSRSSVISMIDTFSNENQIEIYPEMERSATNAAD